MSFSGETLFAFTLSNLFSLLLKQTEIKRDKRIRERQEDSTELVGINVRGLSSVEESHLCPMTSMQCTCLFYLCLAAGGVGTARLHVAVPAEV